MVKSFGLVLITALGLAKGHVAYWNTPNKLQPVHGLYVKPSVDGTTGDLYVAATEESGSKSQWLTDQPINFLPAATQPIAYASNIALPEEVNPQKRAVISSPLQYTYAYPVPGHTGDTNSLQYPYTLPTSAVTTVPSETPLPVNKDAPGSPALSQYQPFQYLYPQMLSAYADLLNAFKDTNGVTEETSNTATTQTTQTPPVWPPTYAYPVQYVMVDPSMWAQNQAAVSSTPSSPATSTTVTDIE